MPNPRDRAPRDSRRRVAPTARAAAPGALVLVLALACTQERADPRRGEDLQAHAEPIPAQTQPNEPPMPAPIRTPQGTLPIEEVAKYPLPGTAVAGSFQWSPDGRWLTSLDSADGSLVRQLWVEPIDGSAPRRVMFEPPDGGATEENLSPEEKLQRERKRERNLGVTQYAWAKTGARVLVPLRGDLWVQDGPDATPRKVVDTEGAPALDPLLSRDGKHLAWVQDAEVYALSLDPSSGGAGAKPRQLTTGARGTGKTHGLAEYIAQEEMGRHRGFWWSHDGERIAYTEVDETHIPTYRIAHQGRPDPTSYEDHGYPFAGQPNAKVRLGVVKRTGGPTVWMELGLEGQPPTDDLYLARVHWLPDGGLVAQIQDRAQSRLDLVRFDPATGQRTLLLTETSDVWINLHDDFRPLEATEGELAGAFLWASEKSGFRHLYLHDRSGTQLRALTAGEWMVDGIEGVDEAGGQVYFTATKDGATEQHLYRVPLAGGEIVRLTPEPGMHGIAMSEDCRTFVDTHSDLESPPRITQTFVR